MQYIYPIIFCLCPGAWSSNIFLPRLVSTGEGCGPQLREWCLESDNTAQCAKTHLMLAFPSPMLLTSWFVSPQLLSPFSEGNRFLLGARYFPLSAQLLLFLLRGFPRDPYPLWHSIMQAGYFQQTPAPSDRSVPMPQKKKQYLWNAKFSPHHTLQKKAQQGLEGQFSDAFSGQASVHPQTWLPEQSSQNIPEQSQPS